MCELELRADLKALTSAEHNPQTGLWGYFYASPQRGMKTP